MLDRHRDRRARHSQDLSGRSRSRQGHQLRGRQPARCSACSGRTAPASRRRSACSPPRSRPTGGSARVAGFDVAEEPLAARRVSGIVFQDSAIDRALTGRRNLDIHARLWGVEPGAAGARIDELADDARTSAELLDRDPSRPTAAASAGGSRSPARSSREPRVLFLDEPTVGLDPRIRHELLEVIGRLRDRGEMTIMLTTHYLDEAERLCDRVAIIHAGRIIALDTPAALVAGLGDELVELRVERRRRRRARLAARARHRRRRRLRGRRDAHRPVHGRTAARRDRRHPRRRTWAQARSRPAGPTLDDVYLQTHRRPARARPPDATERRSPWPPRNHRGRASAVASARPQPARPARDARARGASSSAPARRASCSCRC